MIPWDKTDLELEAEDFFGLTGVSMEGVDLETDMDLIQLTGGVESLFGAMVKSESSQHSVFLDIQIVKEHLIEMDDNSFKAFDVLFLPKPSLSKADCMEPAQ